MCIRDRFKSMNSTTNSTALTDEEYLLLEETYNAYWLLINSPLVFFMQVGFLMLEVGSIRVKNAKNILLKNVVDTAISGLVFYAFGFGFAFGNQGESNPFIGESDFMLFGYREYFFFFYQLTFCSAATTIISGAVAERIRFEAYMVIAFFLSGIIYPLVVHWIWSSDGWLFELQVIDFAGSGVVHLLGGTVAFWGAVAVGPRKGRFVKGKIIQLPGHSIILCCLGVFCLWFGWYGFNLGSSIIITNGFWIIAERVAVNTTLAPTFSGIVTLLYHRLRFREYNLIKIFNATLAGLVAITGGCAVVGSDDAIIIGSIAAIFYESSSNLLLLLKVDDVLEATAVHAACGAWGLLACGLFARPEFVEQAYPSYTHAGLLYSGDFYFVAIQLLTIAIIFTWATLTGGSLLLILKLLKVLRVDESTEEKGLDKTAHGSYAYANIQIKISEYATVRRDLFA
eukprot:TRINITY_DN7040_c0_g1_i1.p1 TRINITY_DN7040_c0_g1~~TRINITY_DN7040_c0_g1_i1.p1  ORF type:complete len:454 (+),score=201.95 TRINITY_DN7040_c0_g1_i1:1-1362(+)